MALSQSQTRVSALGALLHGSCKPNQLTHGCCNQNQDFDSTSKDLDNSSKALPYKSYATSTVGGLVAQPQTAPLCPLDTSPTGRPLPKPFRSTPPKCGADQNALPRGVINVAPYKSAVAFSELTEAVEKKHLLLSKPYVIITLFASRPRCG